MKAFAWSLLKSFVTWSFRDSLSVSSSLSFSSAKAGCKAIEQELGDMARLEFGWWQHILHCNEVGLWWGRDQKQPPSWSWPPPWPWPCWALLQQSVRKEKVKWEAIFLGSNGAFVLSFGIFNQFFKITRVKTYYFDYLTSQNRRHVTSCYFTVNILSDSDVLNWYRICLRLESISFYFSKLYSILKSASILESCLFHSWLLKKQISKKLRIISTT